ncbi:MAG: FGGY-family carbohydrate kinase, partial [Microbacterium sp.]
ETMRAENVARATIEGVLCGLAAGFDAIRGQGVKAERLLFVGGAAQNDAVQRIAAQVFDAQVLLPEPREYVATGAARQAATAAGIDEVWPRPITVAHSVDTRGIIREQYNARLP